MEPLTYYDWVVVVLIALGVLLTAVTLGIGILAFVGWQSIQTTARSVAYEAAKEELEALYSMSSDAESYGDYLGDLGDEVSRDVE